MNKENTICPVCGYNLGFPAWQGDCLQMRFAHHAVSSLDIMIQKVGNLES